MLLLIVTDEIQSLKSLVFNYWLFQSCDSVEDQAPKNPA